MQSQKKCSVFGDVNVAQLSLLNCVKFYFVLSSDDSFLKILEIYNFQLFNICFYCVLIFLLQYSK